MIESIVSWIKEYFISSECDSLDMDGRDERRFRMSITYDTFIFEIALQRISGIRVINLRYENVP